MKKRFLGIPIPVVAIVLAILLAGGGALASFLMTRDITSTVQIVGAGAEVYQDEACTVELTELDFGAIEAGGAADPLTFWVRNESDGGYGIYVALSRTGLDPLLNLYEGEANVVPEDPNNLPLATGSDYEAGCWEAGAFMGTLANTIDAEATEITVDGFPGGIMPSELLYCEGEVISYTSLTGDVQKTFSGCTRGIEGTTTASHSAGVTISKAVWVPETGGDIYELNPDGVLPVIVYLEADAAIERGDYPFTLTIYAQDSPF